ncbi:MAG: ABC transporter permease [Cyclobacteriaceae bacterium]|nr:ABC transporter permease [Cyclobacteriaceae bacterium]
MFDYDKWQEILGTIKKNKLRTFLTMFGVFWGIFMLMILMGSGNGLENGVNKEFKGWASNSGFIWRGRTTMPYKGLQSGRYVNFTNEDQEALLNRVTELEYLIPRNSKRNPGNNVTRANKSGAFRVFGDYPEIQHIQLVDILEGRHLNFLDIKNRRKNAVIGEYVKKVLFGPNEDPIGNYIKANGVYFQVVGVFKSQRDGQQAERDEQSIFIPFSTFQQAFSFGNSVGWFAFTAKPGYSVGDAEQNIRKVLMERHKIHPEDVNALGSNNLQKEFERINRLFSGINVFVWIVGIGTLMAGVIGVSNIMLIIVKERTKEIGIRKSLGATPFSITGLIIQEAIFITMIAGYLGLAVGVFVLSGISYVMEEWNIETGMFSNPEVNLQSAVFSLLVLVICGALAGLVPAAKAAKVNPIEALHAE